MTRVGLVGAVAVAVLAIGGPRVARSEPASCRAQALVTLGGPSRAAAIGPGGLVVGSADAGAGTVAVVFGRDDAPPMALGTLGGVASAARGVGRSVVVGSAEVGPEVTHAFVWDRRGLRDLGALGAGRDAVAMAANQRGEIVGYSQTARSNASPYHAFVVRRGRMIDLGAPGGADSVASDINDHGMVVGFYGRSTGGSVAFLHWQGRFNDLGHLGGGDAEARAINEHGQIVGVSQTADGQRHAFRWSGTMRDLGTLGGTHSAALGLDGDGEVVGTAETADGAMHAFLVAGDGPMVDLQALAKPDGAVLIEAVGVDEAGRIAANGRLADGSDRAFLLTGCR
jgi:probable HAF family extracellular repeat protein